MTEITGPDDASARAKIMRLLRPEQIAALNAYPAPEDIKTRKAPGDLTVAYLGKDYIIQNLERIFGSEWINIRASELAVIEKGPTTTRRYVNKGFELVPGYQAAFSCLVTIEITIPGRDGGPSHTFKKSAYGTDSQTMPERDGVMPINETIEMAAKGANTNALKRAAELLGRVFGLNIKDAPTNEAQRKPSLRPGSSLAERVLGHSRPQDETPPAATATEEPKAESTTAIQPPAETSSGPDLASVNNDTRPVATTKTQQDWTIIFRGIQEMIGTDGPIAAASKLRSLRDAIKKENKPTLERWTAEMTKYIRSAANTENASTLATVDDILREDNARG